SIFRIRTATTLRSILDLRNKNGWQEEQSMLPIPAIDMIDGKCVRLRQGDYDQVTEFSDDPVKVACRWAEQGAERIHLVDLDGAKQGRPVNTQVVREIVRQ